MSLFNFVKRDLLTFISVDVVFACMSVQPVCMPGGCGGQMRH